jgi:beta-galactosidase
MRYKLLFISLLIASMSFAKAPKPLYRIHTNFDNGWRFSLQADNRAAALAYDDSHWRLLNLPHDWAIEGKFSKDNPAGIHGGALPGGLGWYRKTFTLHNANAFKHYYIDFDGVYMNSEVFLNGHSLGVRPYGYISFEYDMTPYISLTGENVIAVKVDNSKQPNSRWYSGCGIYRHVYLIEVGDIHIAHWGTQITTPKVSAEEATVDVKVTIKNEVAKADKVVIKNRIEDAQGKEVAFNSATVNLPAGAALTDNTQSIRISNPRLWSIDKPTLYTVYTYIQKGDETIDSYESTFGIRTLRFDANTGFYLNGKNLKLKGVCDHHDLGCLGSAMNDAALHRQIKILKEMGCNAIRCSHNPPSPELLNLCDSMGLVVMDEAFDMWHRSKKTYDYSLYFDKWYKYDLTDLILRDRNHPSVVIWSIGNEIPEQRKDEKADTLTLDQAKTVFNFDQKDVDQAKKDNMNVNSLLTKKLVDIVKSLDNTRPVTAACDEPSPENNLFRSGAFDIIGINYHDQAVIDLPKNIPNKPCFFSESTSALETRGYYKMPSDSIYIYPDRWDKPCTDTSFKCSGYDNCRVPWGSTHENTWDVVKHYPHIFGQFIWTGFDYIGEPTPYDWPAHSSYFGIIDLAGIPKDSYYMYQSEWTNKPVLHLFPHWNWTKGQKIDMWAYYNNADNVELFINGKSQGVKSKSEHCFHALWHCIFEPGTVKVVARKNGKIVRQQTIRTAGAPAGIRLIPDKRTIKCDGQDLCFVTVEVIDKNGNLCPNAENLVQFNVAGPAFIAGVDNGCETSLESFKDNKRKAFYGKCLVVLQSNSKPGTITLTATSQNLAKSTLKIEEH